MLFNSCFTCFKLSLQFPGLFFCFSNSLNVFSVLIYCWVFFCFFIFKSLFFNCCFSCFLHFVCFLLNSCHFGFIWVKFLGCCSKCCCLLSCRCIWYCFSLSNWSWLWYNFLDLFNLLSSCYFLFCCLCLLSYLLSLCLFICNLLCVLCLSLCLFSILHLLLFSCFCISHLLKISIF